MINRTAAARRRFSLLRACQRGATAIEYGLIAALIAVAAMASMKGLGTQLKTTFNSVSSNMASG